MRIYAYIHFLPCSNCKEYAFIGRGVRALRDLTDTYSDEVERSRARKFRYRYFHGTVIAYVLIHYIHTYMHTL